MFNSIEQLFHEPIKELNNFYLLKENVTYQDFIELYLQSSSNKEKINLLKTFLNIFSHEKSLINICYFCLKNNKVKEIEFELEDNLEKSNFSSLLPQENFQLWLIEKFFEEKDEKIKLYLKEIFVKIISVFGINKYYLNEIYEKLTKIYFYSINEDDNDETSINNLLNNLKFLAAGYGLNINEKIGQKNKNTNFDLNNIYNIKPYNFYFFKGKENIKIAPTITSNDKTKLNDGITISTSFNCILNPIYTNMDQIASKNISKYIYSTIFNITFNNGNKLLLKIDAKMNLFLFLSDNKYNNQVNLGKIEENKWYKISITLNTNKKNKKFPINIIINNTPLSQIKEIESEQAKITEINNITLFENFIGFMTDFILFNKLIEKDTINLYQKQFNYGLYKFNHVNKFIEQINPQILKNLIILLIPTNDYDSDELPNLANNYEANNKFTNFDIKYISENTGKINITNTIMNSRFDKKISLLGGMENILPFLEIFIKLGKDDIGDEFDIFQKCIFAVLSIINTILINKKTNLETISKSNFFGILSTFFQNLTVLSYTNIKKEIFNDEITKIIIDLANYLFNISEKREKSEKFRINSFLDNFLFNVKIIKKFSIKNQNLIFDFVSKNISKINPEEMLLINVDNLLFLLQYYNENYKNFFCCDYHQGFYGETNKKLMDLKSPFNLITQIIGKISKFNEDIYIKILHFLIIRSKPCLIKFIIKNIFIYNLNNNNKSKNSINKNEKNKFIKYLVKNDLLNTLLFLISTYAYPDIINEIINLFSIISIEIKSFDNSANNFFNKENNINFISKSILPIYIRIKPLQIKIDTNNNKNNIKKIAMSEIVIHKNQTENIKNFNIKENNLDNNSENVYFIDDNENENEINKEDDDEIDLIENNKRFINSEKVKIRLRKQSGDNFHHIRKLNLEKISTIDLGSNIHEENIQEKNKNKISQDDSDLNRLNFDNFNTNLNPANIFRSPRKLNSVVESVINFARINDKKMKSIFNKPNFEKIYENSLVEYKSLEPILDKLNEEKIDSYKKIILEALMNWLKADFSNYVLKIISNFLNTNKIEYIHIYEFIEILSSIINEQIYTKKNKLSTQLFDLDFYFWYTDCMFQFYLAKIGKEDLIYSNNIIIFPKIKNEKMKESIQSTLMKGLKILINLIINIKIEKNELIKLFDILLLCGTRIKKYYSLNQKTIIYLNNFYSDFFSDILKEYNKYYSSANSEQLLPVINICYEYMLFFNNENKSEEIKNFMINDNQIFNGIMLSGINTNNTDNKDMTNLPISQFWTDYQLFKSIMKVLKQIINIDNIDYKDDKYLEENILSHKKSDTFLDKILFLCNLNNKNNNLNINNINNNNLNINNNTNKPLINKEEIKNGELPLIYIISNIYVITLNLANKKEEKEEILKEYKMYIIFLILASTNLSFNSTTLNIIQTKVEIILVYFIGFIIERYKNGLDKDLLLPCLNEVFILLIKVLKRTYDQRSKRKGSKIFDKIISITTTQKKIDFSKSAVYRIFSKDNMSNVFNKDFVYTMKKNNFQFFNDKSYLIQLLLSCVDLKLIKKEIKNIFFADIYLKKGHERILKIKEMKIGDLGLSQIQKKNWDNQYDIQFFKMRRKITSAMENNLSALEEEIKLFKEKKYLEKEKIKLFYKKIKKKIFSFSGLWSYKDIFYKNDNINNYNIEDGDNETLSEKNSSSENSLAEMINKQRNKYQNKHMLKYKLANHYGKIPLRPILSPIYDINTYLPLFSLFNKNNLFIENGENKDIISIMNLNMNEIFNEEEENLNENFDNIDEEESDSIILNIFKSIFPNIYNNLMNKVNSNLQTDELNAAPLSGFILNSHICCYVIQMSHIKGFLYFNKNYCSFIQNFYDENNNKKLKEKEDDFDKEKKMCFGSYLKLNQSKYVYFKIKYTSIQFIFLRNYYYKDSAIEIFTSKNKVYYLNFPDPFRRQNALNLLLNKFSNKKEIKISKNKLIGYNLSPSDNNFLNFPTNNPNSDFILNITENWQDWNISTMELLLWLNILSNRSFNDLSQYPVFPWILTQYEDILNQNKETSLSKSVMPDMISSSNPKSNLKITTTYGKSNLGDMKHKTKGSGFLKNFGKKKTPDEMKVEDPGNNDNNNLERNEKIYNYDQFPIQDKKSQIILDKDIRNFSLPMGMMTLTEAGEKRKNNYIEKFTLMKKESPESPQSLGNKFYIYGSHYSNPLYVCHYLTRVFPYCNISIELQGDKFDDPNRMLISVSKSFEASSSHEGDLRELIPEFFYLPELFINKNNLDLKIKNKKNKNKSNDVTCPNWANNNNYIFITKLKTFLESEEVNKTINKWFDLIFGYKQKGKEAENAFNLFIPSSYDNFDIEKEALTPDQKIYFLRLTEFGLTPHQIIFKKFNKRKQKDNKKKCISENWREKEVIINNFRSKKNENNKNALKILKLQFIGEENFLAVLDNYQFIKNEIMNFQNANEQNVLFDSKPKYYIKKDKIQKLNFLKVKYNEIMNKCYPIIIYSKGAFIAEGGYYNGRIIVSQLNPKIKSKNINNAEAAIIQTFEVFNKMDSSPVIDLFITKDEKHILSGSLFGSVVIYKNEINSWKKKYQVNDHFNIPITSIYHNDILNLWGSAGYDGYINIYTFPSNKKISSIKIEESAQSADYIFISASPLACFIVYSSHNFSFYTYSLIGQLINKVVENETYIYSPIILKESNFGEILIYGNDKGQINMRYLPSLDLFLNRNINTNEEYDYISLDLIDISHNGWYLIGWNNDNSIFSAMYDSSHISEKEELLIMHLVNDLDE